MFEMSYLGDGLEVYISRIHCEAQSNLGMRSSGHAQFAPSSRQMSIEADIYDHMAHLASVKRYVSK